jgi:protein-S-isoprenylcysteine O-methyltransferase Ste14
MNPWFAKVMILLARIAMVAIRAPHGRRSCTIPVVRSCKGPRETVLLTIVGLAFFLPLIWIATPVFAFADYPLHPIPFLTGGLCLALGLSLFHRSHVDLGRNWSMTLEVREQHRLVQQGLYRWVRHPMYLALLIDSLGEALVVPNWLVGPYYGMALVVILAFRLGPEERMLLAKFGKDYEVYRATTKRLIPAVW